MDWLPDWSGRVVSLVGSGPALAASNLAALRGRTPVVVVNRAFEAAPWADLLYAADHAFWNAYPAARAFPGLKVSGAKHAHECWPEIHHLPASNGDPLSFDRGSISGGPCSGFQALNLILHAGARAIALYGFDMKGGHFHGDHPDPLGNPDESNFRRWRQLFEDAAPVLERKGVTVMNATPGSTLKCFPSIVPTVH